MVVLESVRMALHSLWANPLRSFLTLIGIAVGIAAVLHVVGLGEVTRQRINERLATMGTDVLTIRPGAARSQGIRREDKVTTLTRSDAHELERESDVITAAVATYGEPANAEYRGKNWWTYITGAAASQFAVNNDSLAAGRAFTERDVEERARVAVIGDTVREKLFGDADPAGEHILVNGKRFTVIGALAGKGEGWWDPDDQILIPITTAQERLFGVSHLSNILAQMRGPDDFEEALFDIETVLRRNHRLRDDQPNDFRVRRQDLHLSSVQDTNQQIAEFVLIIAGVSLLVGGLGIANVMLVSVTERTREIGVRRALGANRLHILVQFLTEAMVLGIVGGVIGIAGGLAFNYFNIGPDAPLSWDWVVYSFAICAGIGMVAGMYPATRAAYANVLEALQYE